jgi:hypothetical protein
MIYVKRNPEESSQKAISMFLKRVKKYNLVARKRKTAFAIKPPTHLQKQRKAIRKANYLQQQKISSKSSK